MIMVPFPVFRNRHSEVPVHYCIPSSTEEQVPLNSVRLWSSCQGLK